MPLRDLFRRRRASPARPAADATPLTEDDVRRLQRVQRSAPKAVRVLRRGQ